MAIHSISLFSGIGGLDLGVELATGSRVVCYVEREVFAASVLAARMRDGAIAPAPVWSDVATFDARAWRGRVDLVTGGFPCQDISVAGRGLGLEGERSGLWSEQLRVFRDSGARWLFVENVAALLVRGLGRVLADLAALGCDAEWTTLRASDVGAPHRRERLFLLARRVSDPERDAIRLEPERREVGARATDERHTEPRDMGAHALADSDSHGRESERRAWLLDRERPTLGHDAHRCDAHVADTETRGIRRGRASGERRQSPLADEGAFPPGPGDDWTRIERHLQPAIKPGLRVVVDGTPVVVDAARGHQLRALGNGVVPFQAAVAFRELASRLAWPTVAD